MLKKPPASDETIRSSDDVAVLDAIKLFDCLEPCQHENIEEYISNNELPRINSRNEISVIPANDAVYWRSSSSQMFDSQDVLFGRGGGTNKHVGNIKFRKLAGEYKFEYRNAPTKARKTQISTLVLEKVYSYGGRFLEQNKESNQWEDTPKKRARTKVAQILR